MVDGASSDAVRVLVVCTGNVCRSPYIERRMQAALDESWGPGCVLVSSAGTGALAGHPMDPRAEARLARAGLGATGFVARDLTADLVAEAALTITATRQHRGVVAQLHPKALSRVHALADLTHLCAGVEPPDPVDGEAVTAAAWFSIVVPWLAQRRGQVPPLSDEQSQITDPYGRDDAAFEEMAADIEAALPAVLRVIGPPQA